MLLEFIDDPETRLPRPISFFSCHDKWDLKPCIPIPARIEPYQGLDMLLHRLQRCRLVIAERLHGAILSHAVGTPVVQIVDERKCLDYMESVGCRDVCVWPGDIGSLQQACDAAAQCLVTAAQRIGQNRALLQQSVDRFLSRLHANPK